MKIHRSFFLLVASSLLLWGCAPSVWQTEQTVSPRSYQASLGHIPRNVGKLRRLDVLVIHQQPPGICVPGSDGAVMVVSPLGGQATKILDYLKSQKGYEITELDSTRYQAWLDNSSNHEFRKEISEWSASTDKDAPLGPLGAALLDQIGAGDKTDGLLLLHIQDSCPYAIPEYRAALSLMSLGLYELFPPRELTELYPTCRTSILETASKKVVWRNVRGMDMSLTKVFSCTSEKENNLDVLFKDLEPAIPKLLTR